MSKSELERPLTLRQAVSDKRDLTDEYRAGMIKVLEELEIADLLILHDSVGLGKPITLLEPAEGGILSPILEATDDEFCQRQQVLIGQQHNCIRQQTFIIRCLSRLTEQFMSATVFATTGGDDGPST